MHIKREEIKWFDYFWYSNYFNFFILIFLRLYLFTLKVSNFVIKKLAFSFNC